MRIEKIFLVVAMTFSLVACSSLSLNKNAHPNKAIQGIVLGSTTGAVVGAASSTIALPVGALIGATAGGLIGYSEYSKESAKYRFDDRLYTNGIRIYAKGDLIRIVIPAKKVFHTHSPRMQGYTPTLMRDVATFLRQYQTVDVKVAGYTDNVGLPDRNIALSTARAQNIANLLWANKVDTRLMAVRGYGAKYPIANNKSESGRELNRRIEITTRKVA